LGRSFTREFGRIQDVVAMKVPSTFDSLEIEESSAEQIGQHADAVKGRSVWSLRGCGFDGFVVAGVYGCIRRWSAPFRGPKLSQT
jgi:hypothetical protein